MMMHSWKIQARIQQCQGIMLDNKHLYSIIVRLDNNFSQPSSTPRIVRNKLIFKTSIVLEFETNSPQLPSNNLQILLIKNQTKNNTVKINSSDNSLINVEQIIGIASIKIHYPLPSQFQQLKTYSFDRSFEKKSAIKMSLTLSRQSKDLPPTQQQNAQSNHSQQEPLLTLLQLQIQKNKQYQKHLSSVFEQLNNAHLYHNKKSPAITKSPAKNSSNYSQLQKERDQLYKISESLYKELKDCSIERDQFLRELRQKELYSQQLKQQFQFLKLKLGQCEDTIENHHSVVEQLQYFKNQNMSLKICLEQKEKEALQLERKIKESLIGIQNFRKEASQARNQLLNREFQYSNVSRGSKYLDPVQIIEELSYEIRNRKLENIFVQPLKCSKIQLDKFYKVLQKEVIILFTELISKMPSLKLFLINKKSHFLHKIQELTFAQAIQT